MLCWTTEVEFPFWTVCDLPRDWHNLDHLSKCLWNLASMLNNFIDVGIQDEVKRDCLVNLKYARY